MAYKLTLIFLLIVSLCYFIGVTWGDEATLKVNDDVQNKTSLMNGSSNSSTVSTPQTLVISTAPTKIDQKSIPILTPTNRSLSPASVPPKNSTTPKCVCDGALLPRLGENGKELEICSECKCQHEARNTTLIKVVVIIVIWVISILVIYMLFLMCLDPLLNKRVKANYQEHTNEDDDASVFPPLPVNNQELNSRANVLNRVGHQQDKWKRQVREQRRHIYDRRTMLN